MQEIKKPKTKILFIIIDGIGELGIPARNNKTPLQYLDLPNMNAIAKSGISGQMDPVETGISIKLYSYLTRTGMRK
jgi:2,3-bisphosphoglycerate-independent phosphoglycerate mutase